MADDQGRRLEGHGKGGGTEGERRQARRRTTETASWLVVAAMMVVGGGAVGYMYMQHKIAPTAARAHTQPPRSRRHARTATAARTAVRPPSSAAHARTTAYYPALGTPTRPVDGDVIEPFGWQYEKSIGLYRDVPGWALAAAKGSAVRAVIGGRVVANWVDPTEGREVVVDSRNGDSIIYGDLASPGPAVGSEVTAGEAFAHVGDVGKLSGVSTPHLFLEVTVGGQPVSPVLLLGDLPGAGALPSGGASGTTQGSTSATVGA